MEGTNHVGNSRLGCPARAKPGRPIPTPTTKKRMRIFPAPAPSLGKKLKEVRLHRPQIDMHERSRGLHPRNPHPHSRAHHRIKHRGLKACASQLSLNPRPIRLDSSHSSFFPRRHLFDPGHARPASSHLRLEAPTAVAAWQDAVSSCAAVILACVKNQSARPAAKASTGPVRLSIRSTTRPTFRRAHSAPPS